MTAVSRGPSGNGVARINEVTKALFTFNQSLKPRLSVMRHLLYGMKSLSKFEMALHWVPLGLRGSLRHAIFIVSPLIPTTPSPPTATVRSLGKVVVATVKILDSESKREAAREKSWR